MFGPGRQFAQPWSALQGYDLPQNADFMDRVDGVFRCKHCDYTTSNTYSIAGHMTKHTGVNYFKCLGCGETFPTAGKMKLHMKELHA